MKAEDIIEGLNLHIEDIRKVRHIETKGHLVLQRTIATNTVFKAYKTYKATVWFVKDRSKYAVISTDYTAKVLDSQEEKIERIINVNLCHDLFNWINSDYYNQVVEGVFKGYDAKN